MPTLVSRPALSSEEIVNYVRHLAPPLFKGCTSDELKVVLEAASLRRLKSGSVLFREGQPSDRFFLLLDGQVQLCQNRNGEMVYVSGLGARDIVGVTAMMPNPTQYSVCAEMATDGHVLVWDRGVIRSLSYCFPCLFDNALGIFGDYAIHFRRMNIAQSHGNIEQRLVLCLNFLANWQNNGKEKIELPVSNRELAHMITVSESNVSRVLAEWARKGLVEKGRGKLVIHSMDGLRKATS